MAFHHVVTRACGLITLGLGALALGQTQTPPVFKPLAMPVIPLIAKSEKQLLDGAAERIEYFRKGYVRVIVKDPKGGYVKNAKVTIQQLRHGFLFGANLFDLDLDDTSVTQRIYQQRFEDVFNYATLPFYWSAFERKKGEPEFDRLDRMVNWALERKIALKGHPLIWQGFYPGWAAQDAETTELQLRARVTELLQHYAGKVDYWDLINEINAAPGSGTGVGAWVSQQGAPNAVRSALGWARASGSKDMRFVLNDYETGDLNLTLLRQLQAAKALPDAIGLQSEMLGGTWNSDFLWKTVTNFAKFGRPIHFTELGILSGQPMQGGKAPKPWPSVPALEAKQANDVARVYTLLFSHPAVSAITTWNLADKSAPTGWLRSDRSSKPVFDRMRRLLREKWWTVKTATTDVNGELRIRAFLGSYRVSVEVNGEPREATLDVTQGGIAETRLIVQL